MRAFNYFSTKRLAAEAFFENVGIIKLFPVFCEILNFKQKFRNLCFFLRENILKNNWRQKWANKKNIFANYWQAAVFPTNQHPGWQLPPISAACNMNQVASPACYCMYIYGTCVRCPGRKWLGRWTRSWHSWTPAPGWCGWWHTHPTRCPPRPQHKAMDTVQPYIETTLVRRGKNLHICAYWPPEWWRGGGTVSYSSFLHNKGS